MEKVMNSGLTIFIITLLTRYRTLNFVFSAERIHCCPPPDNAFVHSAAYQCPVETRWLWWGSPYTSGWQDWGAWGLCDHTCGGGIRVRSRICILWVNTARGNAIDISHSQTDQSICGQSCFNHGIFMNGKCQCTAGNKGYCCEAVPICRPVCRNNGTCIADDTCNCLPGYFGHICEIGGNLNELLLPKLHPALPVNDLYQPLSWYDSPDYDSSNQVCFVKVHVQNAPYDTIVTAESSAVNETTNSFGNFTAGPIDSSAKTNGSSRFACLQVRCPGTYTTGEEFDVIVNVSVGTGFKRCHIRHQSHPLINVYVSSSQVGSDSFKVDLENGNNYGPSYGIYFNTGYLDKAVYLAKSTCYSGYSFDYSHFNPSTGILAEYICS